MKKRFLSILCLIITCAITVTNAQQTFNVPQDSVLNEFIANHKAASGLSTYVLERDGYYVLTGAIGFTGEIAIVAAEGTGARPVIVHGVNDEGATLGWGMYWLTGSATFKGLNIKNTNVLGKRGPWHSGFGTIVGDQRVVEFDDCILEFGDGALIWGEAGSIKTLKVTNNIFRWNGTNDGGKWQGFACLLKNGDIETAIIENNTFVENYAPIFIHENGHLKNMFFNHNTVVSNGQFPLRYQYASRAVTMNNLFVDAPFSAERPTDVLTDPDKQPAGVYSLDYYRVDSLRPQGYPAENQRINVIVYNANYLSNEVKNYITSVDSLKFAPLANANGFLNERAMKMMKSDGFNYPYFKWSDEYSVFTENPVFSGYTLKVAEEVDIAKNMLGDKSITLSTENGQWGRFPEKGADLTAAAPLPYDYYKFDYTNAKYLIAATAGYPLGDLNWFPEKKAAWSADSKKEDYAKIIASVLDGTFKFGPSVSADKFNQTSVLVYPNPASTVVRIDGANDEIKSIYSITGSLIRSTVENEINVSDLKAGLYILKVGAQSHKLQIQ